MYIMARTPYCLLSWSPILSAKEARGGAREVSSTKSKRTEESALMLVQSSMKTRGSRTGTLAPHLIKQLISRIRKYKHYIHSFVKICTCVHRCTNPTFTSVGSNVAIWKEHFLPRRKMKVR